MAELKTKKIIRSVDDFIASVEDSVKQQDCRLLLELMQQLSGSEASMWGDSIVGFGNFHYKYASGREGDWFEAGFSPRKQNLTLYLMCGMEHLEDDLKKLGKHKVGKGCLYLKKLADVDMSVLEEIIRKSIAQMRKIS